MVRWLKTRGIALFMVLVMIITLCPADAASAKASKKTPAFTESSATLYLSDDYATTYQLQIVNAADNAEISYTSSRTKIAKVSDDGLITPVKKGKATIKATVTQGEKTYKLSFACTVKKASLKFATRAAKKASEDAPAQIEVGETLKTGLRLNGEIVSVRSSSKDTDYNIKAVVYNADTGKRLATSRSAATNKYVTISEIGRVTGQRVGNYYIEFLSVPTGLTQRLYVTVNKAKKPSPTEVPASTPTPEPTKILLPIYSNPSEPSEPSGPSDPTKTTYPVSFAFAKGSENLGAELPASGNYEEGTTVGDLPTPYLFNGIFKGWYYDADKSSAAASSDVISSGKTLYADMIMANEQDIAENPIYITVTLTPDKVSGFTFAINDYEEGCIDSFVNVADGSDVDFSVSGETIIPKLYQGNTYSLTLNDCGPVQESNVRLVVGGEIQPASVTRLNIITEKEAVMKLSLDPGMKYISTEAVTDMEGKTLDGLFTANLGSGSSSADANRYKGSFTYTGTEILKVGDKLAIYDGMDPRARTLEMAGTDEDGNIAYVTVISVTGNKIGYTSTDATEVIDFVEVLPIPIDYDEDGSKTNHSITIDTDYIDYSKSAYASMGLDGDTTVDVDDYLALFSGGETPGIDSVLEGYGRITSVTAADTPDGTVITIEYVDVTEEEVNTSMDLYNTRNADIDLTEEEISRMEDDIKQQAINSGFLDEAAEYLVALALETDCYQELNDDFDLDLESYNIKLVDASEDINPNDLQMMGATAELKKEDTDVYVHIKPGKLEHYAGQNGIRIELGMKIVVEFKSDKLKTGHLELEIEACFIEEVLLDVNISGGAVWKKAWIFPYIADYQATANLDLGSYTSVGITATLKTEEDDDDDDDDDKKDDDKDNNNTDNNNTDNNNTGSGNNNNSGSGNNNNTGSSSGNNDNNKKETFLGNQWKKLGIDKLDKDSPESVGNFIANIGNQMTELATKKGFMGGVFSDDGDEDEADTLSSKYAEFIEESSDSWIPIVKKEIFKVEGGIDPLHILAFSITGDFVVSANLYITMGARFEVGEAKRYTYNIKVKAKKVTSTVTELERQNLKFEFYVFGTAGIRVGLEFELAVGLLSTKLDSVGLTAEAGAYAQLWGYFYFKYAEWINEAGVREKEKYCSGALYFELGFYVEIHFKAQLFSSDKLTYEPALYEDSWPLLTAGDKANVTAFAAEPDDDGYSATIEIIGKREQKVSPTLFEMSYLDLKEGATATACYDDATESKFDITFSNSKFSYDPKTDTIKISVREGESVNEESDMTIVWKGNALAFSTKSIEKKIKIVWSDPANAKMIFFESNGGSIVKTIALAVNDPIIVPAAPTKQGYIFGGWYTDEAFTSEYTFPARMPDYENKSITVYAKWLPAKDTPYTVEHYIQNASGRYVYDSTDYRIGETDSFPTPESLAKSYTGISYSDAYIPSIRPDGQSMMRIYYKPQICDVAFTYGSLEISTPEGGISDETEPIEYSVTYGTLRYAPTLVMPGYVFRGYRNAATGESLKTDADSMFTVTASETYEAQWTEAENTPYQVKFYVKNPDTDAFDLTETVYREGKTNSAVSTDPAAYSSNYTDAKYLYARTDVKNTDLSNPVISAYGNSVLEFYYNRAQYTLSFMDEDTQVYSPKSVTWGAKVSAPDKPSKQGYSFEGWYTGSSCSAESLVDFNSFTMPAEATTLYADWVASDNIKYVVEHYQQNANDDDYILFKHEDLYGTTGATVTGEYLSIDHFVKNENATGTVLSSVVKPDGSTVLKLYYDRETITITFDAGADDAVLGSAASRKFKYGQNFQVSSPTRTGYAFSNWVDENGKVFAYGTVITLDKDIRLKATWTYDAISFTVEHWVMDTNGEYSSCTLSQPWVIDKVDGQWEHSLSNYSNYSLEESNAIKYVSAAVVSGESVVPTEKTMITEGMTIRLYYERKTFSLVYSMADGGDDSVLNGQTYTHGDAVYYGAPIIKPVLEQTGMTFSVGGNFESTPDYDSLVTMPKEDLHYRIFRTPHEYRVYYSLDTNNVKEGSLFTYGIEQQLEVFTSFNYVKPGYIFSGWTDEEDGSTAKYGDGAKVSNLTTAESIVTLYAVWTPIEVNVSLKLYESLDAGANTVPLSLVSNASALTGLTLTCGTDLVLPAPAIKGYDFQYWATGDRTVADDLGGKGWFTTNVEAKYDSINFADLENGDTLYISGVATPIEYTASWEACDDSVTVTQYSTNLLYITGLNGADGSLHTPTLSVTKVTKAAEILTFDGWYTETEGKGYKLVYNDMRYSLMNGDSVYDIATFPTGLQLSDDGAITFYANWTHNTREYTITVYPAYSNGTTPSNYKSLVYTAEYDTLYSTASRKESDTDVKLLVDELQEVTGFGAFRGWIVCDTDNKPIRDTSGNPMYWKLNGATDFDSGYQTRKVDRDIVLYPDIDYDLWLFGRRVSTLESITYNYAPNAASGGKATFDFRTNRIYLENCQSADISTLTTYNNSNVYSQITSGIQTDRLRIYINGDNLIDVNAADNSATAYNVAAIAVYGSPLLVEDSNGPSTWSGSHGKLTLHVDYTSSNSAATANNVYGIYLEGQSNYYEQGSGGVITGSESTLATEPQIYMWIGVTDVKDFTRDNSDKCIGIKTDSTCLLYNGTLFIWTPTDAANGSCAVSCSQLQTHNDHSVLSYALFGNSFVNGTFLPSSNNETIYYDPNKNNKVAINGYIFKDRAFPLQIWNGTQYGADGAPYNLTDPYTFINDCGKYLKEHQ